MLWPNFPESCGTSSRDFVLPYHIWKKFARNSNFKEIRQNVYKTVTRPIELQVCNVCNCSPDTKCDVQCINRSVFIECDPESCPCGVNCENTVIQRGSNKSIEKFQTNEKGWGIRAQKSIKNNSFIIEYVGEVVTEDEYKRRVTTMYSERSKHESYCLYLDRGMVIDAHSFGNYSRFINHSCDPNCDVQKWYISGQPRMAIFAIKDILANEELSFDYKFQSYDENAIELCHCYSKNCRGTFQKVCVNVL